MNNTGVSGKRSIIIHLYLVQTKRETPAVNSHEYDISKNVKLSQEFQKVKLVRPAYYFNKNDKHHRRQYGVHGQLLKKCIVLLQRFQH